MHTTPPVESASRRTQQGWGRLRPTLSLCAAIVTLAGLAGSAHADPVDELRQQVAEIAGDVPVIGGTLADAIDGGDDGGDGGGDAPVADGGGDGGNADASGNSETNDDEDDEDDESKIRESDFPTLHLTLATGVVSLSPYKIEEATSATLAE